VVFIGSLALHLTRHLLELFPEIVMISTNIFSYVQINFENIPNLPTILFYIDH